VLNSAGFHRLQSLPISPDTRRSNQPCLPTFELQFIHGLSKEQSNRYYDQKCCYQTGKYLCESLGTRSCQNKEVEADSAECQLTNSNWQKFPESNRIESYWIELLCLLLRCVDAVGSSHVRLVNTSSTVRCSFRRGMCECRLKFDFNCSFWELRLWSRLNMILTAPPK